MMSVWPKNSGPFGSYGSVVDHQLADDRDRLPELLEAARALAEKALANIDDRPVGCPPAPVPPRPLPADGIGGLAALELFARRWEPGLSGSAGPRYLGFVTGGATPASLVGDWLTGVYDQNVASAGDSAAAALEHEVIGWLADLLGLGDAFGGSFVTGATMSNFVGLAIGREWLGGGVSVADAGAGALGAVTVLSGTPHASIAKSLSMLGIGRNALRRVRTRPGREAVDVDALAAELDALDGRPAIVVANAGTVNTVDFDDLAAIAALRERHGFWLHVDGAFGAFAALSPKHRHLVEGMALADSVCVDLHKWLNVPYDAAVQFTRRPDLQRSVFRNSAPYLTSDTDAVDFLDLVPENSRRFRALAAWFTLTAYGRAGHREIVERTIGAAHRLSERIAAAPGFRLLAPTRLNVVCFTPTAADVDAVLRSVAESGETLLTPTVYQDTPGIRAAFSNWRITDPDVDRIFAALQAGLTQG